MTIKSGAESWPESVPLIKSYPKKFTLHSNTKNHVNHSKMWPSRNDEFMQMQWNWIELSIVVFGKCKSNQTKPNQAKIDNPKIRKCVRDARLWLRDCNSNSNSNSILEYETLTARLTDRPTDRTTGDVTQLLRSSIISCCWLSPFSPKCVCFWHCNCNCVCASESTYAFCVVFICHACKTQSIKW